MRFLNADGRAGLLVGDTVFDLATATGGVVSADPRAAIADHWDDIVAVATRGSFDGGVRLADVALGPPVPRPPMVMSVVANFPPTERSRFPMVVGKSPSAVVGPFDDVVLPDPLRLPLNEAWVVAEPELGIVMRGGGRHLTATDALSAVAGFVVGQDITERRHEFGTGASPWTWEDLPAKTLGKSFDSFCPIGPALVTLDELVDPSSLMNRCWINGRLVFQHSTAEMLWSAAELVALLSAFMTLPPGLLCLCGCGGTIDGSPIPFLSPGDEIKTEIDGIGTMVNRCVEE